MKLPFDHPDRMDLLRKYGAIYGRFDSHRKNEKLLSLHEVSSTKIYTGQRYIFSHVLNINTVHLSQNAPVCAQDIFQCVVCKHVSFTDISIIVADFLCGQVSS